MVEEANRQQRDEARDQEAAGDLFPEHLPVAAEVVRDIRPGLHGGEPLPPGKPFRCRHVVRVAGLGLDRVGTGLFLEPPGDEQPDPGPHERDQQDPAHELRQGELPAEEDPHHDPDLEDEVRGGELEGHRRSEARALLEDRLRNRNRGVAAGRRGGAEQVARAERSLEPGARDPRLDDAREREAQHERPADLPGHLERVRETVADAVEDDHDGNRIEWL